MTRTIEIWLLDGTILYRDVDFDFDRGCPDSFVTARSDHDPQAGNCRVERVRKAQGAKVIYREVQP